MVRVTRKKTEPVFSLVAVAIVALVLGFPTVEALEGEQQARKMLAENGPRSKGSDRHHGDQTGSAESGFPSTRLDPQRPGDQHHPSDPRPVG